MSTENNSSIFNIRINGRGTSFSIKNKIVAFYCAVIGAENCYESFSNTVLDIAKDWDGKEARGLSEFVVGRVLESLLTKKEKKRYQKILKRLSNESN